MSNSPYYLPHNAHDVSLENLVLDQLIIPWLIFDFILITTLLDIVLILWGEILFWSLLKVQGLKGILELKIILFAIKKKGKKTPYLM